MLPSTRPVERRIKQAFDVELFEHLARNLGVLSDGNSALDRAGFADDQIADRYVTLEYAAYHQRIRYRDFAFDGDAFTDVEPVSVWHRVFRR